MANQRGADRPAAGRGEVQLTTTTTGPDECRITTTATFESAPVEVWAWAWVLGAIGGATILAATGAYGPGLEPDSAHYLSAAESLAAGSGLVGVDGEPFVLWPPLLPAILAPAFFVGVDPLIAGRLLCAACLGFVIGTTVLLTRRVTGSLIAAVVAGFFVLSSAPLLDGFSYLLSEAPFVALLSLIMLRFSKVAIDGDYRGLVVLALASAALALTRYVGAVLIPSGVLLLLLLGPPDFGRRARRAFAFGTIASLPLLLYLARNFALVGSLTGSRGSSSSSLLVFARGLVASAADWLVPWEWIIRLQPFSDEPWALLLFFLLAIVTIAVILWLLVSWWREYARDQSVRRDVAFLFTWVIAYSLFLGVMSLTVHFNPIGRRFLMPILVPSTVLVSLAITVALRRAEVIDRRGPLGWLLIASISGLALLSAGRAVGLIREKRSNGAGGYATSEWQRSPIYRHIAANPPPSGVVTNGADVIYLATGQRRSWVPSIDRRSPGGGAVGSQSTDGITLVWFDRLAWRAYFNTLEELTEGLRLEPLHLESDGGIYVSR